MKFKRQDRDKIKIGSKFFCGASTYMVTNMWSSGVNGRGISITLHCIEGDKFFKGRTIYGRPLSEWYGVEVEF